MNKKVATVGALVVLATGFLVFSAWEKEDKNIINLHENPNVYLKKKPDGLWVFRGYGGMKLSDNPNAKYHFDSDTMKAYVFQNDGSITMYEIRPNGEDAIYRYEKQSCGKLK